MGCCSGSIINNKPCDSLFGNPVQSICTSSFKIKSCTIYDSCSEKWRVLRPKQFNIYIQLLTEAKLV